MNPFTWLKSAVWTLWRWRGLFRERLGRVKAAAEFVADELEANARELGRERYRISFAEPSSRSLSVAAWELHGPTLHAMAAPHSALWEELREAYVALRGPNDSLPDSDHLSDLAQRLRETMRAERL
jgi:hypothetical protein